MTLSVIEALSDIWGTNFEYYYTDISPSFFTKAEKLLEKFKGNLKFSAFDIENPPLEENIPVNYFDMILATDVLHATKNVKKCLQNLRQALRPQGTLFFTETLKQDREITFIFGLLNYWRFEDFELRPYHPCVDGKTWKTLLLESGFEFVDVCPAYMGTLGCITAKANHRNGYDEQLVNHNDNNLKKRWILFSPDKGDIHINLLAGVLKNCGGEVIEVFPPPEVKVDQDEDKIFSEVNTALSSRDIQGVIYAWGIDTNIRDQARIAFPFMHIVKCILNLKNSPKIYVLTRGVHSITDSDVPTNPSGATLFGMVKSLKNENSDLFARYIDLDGADNNIGEITDQILFELAMNKENQEKERVQVAYRDGMRYEPRFNRTSLPRNPEEEDVQLPPNTEKYRLVLPSSRMINDLTFDVLEEETVGENEVEVVARAYALNFRDIFTIIKPTKEFDNLSAVGLDFAGLVTRVGANVERFKIGDRVFGANFKEIQLPSHMVIDADCILHIPQNMTFFEAASLPAVFTTSYHCLISVARMKKGDTVLIHTGSGGVGLSAIQICKHFATKIITTAGSPRKRAYLRSLGIEHVFHSRNTSYQEDIMKVTNGRGVDVVLNSITGPGFKEASLSVCAPNARFVEMSKLAVWTEDEVQKLRPDVEYTIVDLTGFEKKRSEWTKLLDSMKRYLKEGHMTPIPCVQFDALRIRQAFQYFQKAKHIGKVVVAMPEIMMADGQLKICISLFNSDSTYLITGGLGGIGFEVCKWMLEKGATDIILIGRNPPKPEVAQEIDNLNNKTKGCKILVKLCDVGERNQLKTILEEITLTCEKPIRGIHHCAGVLQNNLYANQIWESFSATYKPKVEGTWNIHELTKHLPLEHFVLYSSMTALAGTPGQANHSSANCFQDAFAHYRYSLGLPATTINWGQWSQVGCGKDMDITGILPVSVRRMLNGLEEAIRSQRLQVALGEFDNFNMWYMVCPSFKHYMDDKLLRRLRDSEGSQDTHHILLKSDKFWQEIDEAEGRPEKMEVVMLYIKVILRGALRMEPDEPINHDASMKDLGVDSLMSLELKNSIQNLLGSRLTISVNALKDCNTLRDVANCIVNKLYDDSEEAEAKNLTPAELIDLLKCDCILEETIQPATPKVNTIKTVLVTGCTGQLGPYIICSILKMVPSLGKIVCLVRTKETTAPQDRFQEVLKSMNLVENVDMSKIECVRGDMTKLELGLEKDKYKELVELVDCVIHLATKSNHVENYKKYDTGSRRDIRSVNVGGALNILRFASEMKTKHVYYASALTALFGGRDSQETLSDNWPEMDEINTIAENNIPGYPVSKFVSEMLLKQANDRGIPCKVFRFPWIMGESKSGQMNFMNNHYILRFLSYLKIKAMPQAPLPATLLPVDICADLSIEIFFNGDAPNEIYNIVHPSPQLEVEFVKVAKEEFDVDIELVEWESKEFVEKLYANGMPLESLKEIYEDVDRGLKISKSSAFKAIQGYLANPVSFFENKKVERFVPGFADSIPDTMEIIKKNLSYVKSKGFFEKFGL